VRSLLSQRVVIEEENRQGLSVCNRCQGWGHTKRGCFRLPVCAICMGDHSTHDCANPGATPRCVNCKREGHRPAFKGCPAYQAWLAKRNGQAPQAAPTAPPPNQPPATSAPSHSQAAATTTYAAKAAPAPKGEKGKGGSNQPPAPSTSQSDQPQGSLLSQLTECLAGLDFEFNLTSVVAIVKQVLLVFRQFKSGGLLSALPAIEALLANFL
jgi:hypothetical protein